MKSLTIIGKGSGWENAPAVSREADCWGITQLILRRPVDLVIDMNVYDDGRWGEQARRDAENARLKAKQLNVPYIDLATYPLDEIIAHFKTDYFGSTVDYALALAIYRGYEVMNLYGVNLANPGEYAYQKPSAEFWLGMAMGRGIKVTIHGDHSSLMKTRDRKLYGYDTKQKGLINGNS
jgi:hypothetical protein